MSLEINWSKNITIANYHALSRDAQPRAVPGGGAHVPIPRDIRFRNVHVNAESGYAICDENGCGTFLRVSKFPYENAIQDVTHHLEVREREFAVLDVPAAAGGSRPARRRPRSLEPAARSRSWKAASSRSPAPPSTPPARSTSSITISSGFSLVGGARPDVVRHDPLDPVNLAVDKVRATCWCCRPPGRKARSTRSSPAAPDDEIDRARSRSRRAPHPGAAASLPVNVGTTANSRTSSILDTYELHDAGADVRART